MFNFESYFEDLWIFNRTFILLFYIYHTMDLFYPKYDTIWFDETELFLSSVVTKWNLVWASSIQFQSFFLSIAL